MRLLLQNAGHIVTPQQLRKVLWGDVHVTDDSVPRCISSLRARLENDDCIQTVYKQGYRLTSHVHREMQAAGAHVPRLAIVPFSCGENVAPHLGTAVAEDATTRLTAMRPPIFSMLARDSAFTLAMRGKTAQEVGEALGADLVMTGTVQMTGMQYRLRMEMIRIEDGAQIWVDDVLLPRDRVAELQASVVQRLTFRAGVRFAPLPSGDAGFETNGQAFDSFMRGRYEWQTLERHRMQDGIRCLHQAADLEPKLTQARVDLVRACVAQELLGYIAPRVAAEQVMRAASAVQSQEGARNTIMPAVGWMKFHVERDVVAAERLLESANQTADPWHTLMRAMFATSRRRWPEAAGMLQAGLGADPYSPWLNAALAWTWHLAGDREQSVAQVERCLELAPDHVAACLFGGTILAFNGEVDRAISITGELTRRAPSLDMAMAVHAYALACRGDRETAQEWLERLDWLSRERYVVRSFAAPAYATMGDFGAAIAELHAADEDRCPWFFQILADPRLKELHRMPEFQAMQSRVEGAEDPAGEVANPGIR